MTKSPQYLAVLNQLVALQERLDLKANAKAKEKLLLMFQAKQWLGGTADPTAAALVQLALNRIKDDVNQYGVFIKILQDITGLADIADKITAECPLPAPPQGKVKADEAESQENLNVEEENVICDDTFYQNESDDETTDEDIPEGHEPILATRSLMWPKGRNDDNSARVLRVHFMHKVPLNDEWRIEGDKNDNPITTDYILKVANEWNVCDPTVVPVFENEGQISQSDVRICFKEEGVSHSLVGRTAEKKKYKGRPTMTLNLGKNHQRRTILHEFGHVLGLKHEHQRPDCPDDLYDKEPDGKFYKKLPTSVLDEEKSIYFEYDVDSIMHYRNDVAKRYKRKWRNSLSKGDREGISKAYRKFLGREETDHETGGEDHEAGGFEEVDAPPGNTQSGFRDQEHPVFATKPSLGELTKIRYIKNGEKEEMEIIEMIAQRWIKFGTVGLGLKDYKVNNCDTCCEIFKIFLENGARPKFEKPTWRNVITAVRDTDFGHLADELEETLPLWYDQKKKK